MSSFQSEAKEKKHSSGAMLQSPLPISSAVTFLMVIHHLESIGV